MKTRRWMAITLALSHIFSTGTFSAAARGNLNPSDSWKTSELIAESSRTNDARIDEVKNVLQKAEQFRESGDIDESIFFNLKAVDLLKEQFGHSHYVWQFRC